MVTFQPYSPGIPSTITDSAVFVGHVSDCHVFWKYKKIGGRVPALTPKMSWWCQLKSWHTCTFGQIGVSAENLDECVKLGHCQSSSCGWWISRHGISRMGTWFVLSSWMCCLWLHSHDFSWLGIFSSLSKIKWVYESGQMYTRQVCNI